MDKKPQATADPIVEDLDLYTEWVHEAGHDTLIAYLPGFRKEQLKVQLTSTGKLRLTGERQVGDNKCSRFHKEFLLPPNCDVNQISANFKGGMLHVKLPKLISPPPAPADSPQEKQKPVSTTTDSLQEKGKQAPTTGYMQEKQKPAPTTGTIPTLPPKPTSTNQAPKKDPQTQEPKPVPSNTIPEKTEQSLKPPAREPQKQQSDQEKPLEKVKNDEPDEEIIGTEKDRKKEEKGNLVEGESSKNRAELKTEPAEKEAWSLAAARKKVIETGILDRVGAFKEAVGDLVTDLRSDRKKLVAAMAVVLVAVAVGFVAKIAFESSE